MADFLWRPTEDVIERANVTRLARTHGLESYDALLQRSRDDIEWFWDAVVKDLAIEFTQPYTDVLDTSGGIQWPLWFVGGHVNIAHNCVHRHNGVAVVWEGEEGAAREITYEELSADVCRLADALRDL